MADDYDAVKAGVTLEVSNGQVEGQNNRLKMLKRQMFGRAGIDLFSQALHPDLTVSLPTWLCFTKSSEEPEVGGESGAEVGVILHESPYDVDARFRSLGVG